jgi:hypothetical protein
VNLSANYRPALDAAIASGLQSGGPWRRASEAGRYMRGTVVLCALASMLISACSTAHHPVASADQKNASFGPTPAGDFVLGGTSRPAVKLRVNSDGTYFAEHMSPIEFWPMTEGNTVYPQRVKPEAEEGRWTWNPKTGTLTLAPEKAPQLAYPIDLLQFDPTRPGYLAAGGGLLFERVGRAGK